MTEPKLVAQPGETERCEIPGLNRVYHLRVPSQMERVRYKQALIADRLEFRSPLQLCDALLQGAMRLMADSPEEARGGVKAKVELQRDALAAWFKALGEAGLGNETDAEVIAARAELDRTSDAVEPIAREVADHDARYAALLAKAAVFWEGAGLIAARMFLTGWEGLAEPFPAKMTEAALEAIPPEDLPIIGVRFDSMLSLSGAQRKNSKSPSSLSGEAAIISLH